MDNPKISIASESLRHASAWNVAELDTTLRHEGMKKLVEKGLHLAGGNPLGRFALRHTEGGPIKDPRLHTEVAGLELDGPVGLAPGWDKTGKTIHAWQALGAHHTTIGGVTLFPQRGNPMPRLRTMDQSVGDHGSAVSLNSFGFWNLGANQVIYNIEKQKASGEINIPIILQLTLNKEFYEPHNRYMVRDILSETVKRVLPVADAVNLGLSSPNTVGMRESQDVQKFISEIMYATAYAIKSSDRPVPLILKGDGDGGEKRLDSYARLVEYSDKGTFDAFELINTTGLDHIKERYGLPKQFPGGLAGADPEYQQMALDAVKFVYERVGGRVDIIGVGGINSGAQALKMIEAGASALSINTAVRALGLGAIRIIEKQLLEKIDAVYPDATSLDQIIGAATRKGPKCQAKETSEQIQAKIAERIRTGHYPRD